MVYRIYIIITALFLSYVENVHSKFLDLKTLTKIAEDKKLTLPQPEKDGRFQTLNKRGAAIPFANTLIREFADYSRKGNKRILQIDATYGHQTLKALSKHNLEYVATDSYLDHLALLAVRARNLLSQDALKPLKFFHGTFPESYHHFPDNHFDAVLLNRVIHFYSPQDITKTLKEVYRILKPGGQLFIIAITPYVRRYEGFIPLYKQRVLLKHQYPGYLRDLTSFANPEVTTPEQMEKLHKGEFMFYDAQVMYRILSEHRFFVLRCNEFAIGIDSPTWTMDGRELVGAIARKPIPIHLQDHLITTPADF